MPARNRVAPTGEILTIPLRGAWTGNRGNLHRDRKIVRPHRGNLWIICALEFRGRWQEQWQPRHYTFLYFHDEAVAFAAGHRPCGECRWHSYSAYKAAWSSELAVPPPSAGEMNRQLHRERLDGRTRRLHAAAWTDLPDGAFVIVDDKPAVVVVDHLTQWTHEGYGTRLTRPKTGRAAVLTPPSTLAVLRAGYPVQLDDAAR